MWNETTKIKKISGVKKNNTNKINSNNKNIVTNYVDGENLKYKNTNSDLVNSNLGLREFIKKTYLWTGGGISTSIGIGIAGTELVNLTSAHIPYLLGSGIVLGLGGAIGIGMTKYSIKKNIITTRTKNLNQVEIISTVNSTGRLVSYGSLVTGMGITMIPLCTIYPDALFPAFIASSSIFGGASWYAMTRTEGELEPYGSVLYGGLGGMVGVSLMGLGSNLIFGTNWFGDIAHIVSLYGGIPLFTGLIAYDTHKAIEKYNSGNPDHLGCSTELYLDFLNLFVRFVEIIGKIQSNNKD